MLNAAGLLPGQIIESLLLNIAQVSDPVLVTFELCKNGQKKIEMSVFS